MVYFDLALWAFILIRLPVISICRFRCVCKSWNSLISSSFFNINRHINPPPVSAYDVFFLWNHVHQPPSRCLSYGFYNLRSPPYPPRFLHIPFRDQTINHSMTPYYFQLVNIVHGVVCLTSGPSTVLWNPIIHRYLELPRSPLYAPDCRFHVVGFGFGRKNLDFKVVCVVVGPGEPRPKPVYQVFSTRDGGSWGEPVTDADDDDNVPENMELLCLRNRYSNGAIYWVTSRSSNTVLFMFDCEQEELKTIKLPQQISQCSIRLSTVHGRLMVVAWRSSWHEPERWALEGTVSTMTWKKMPAVTDDNCRPRSMQKLKEFLWKNPDTYPYLFEESLHLMDAKSYMVKEDQRGLVYYVVDGRRVPAELLSTLKMFASSKVVE